MRISKSFGRASLAGQFLGYFFWLYLIVLIIGFVLARSQDAPQRILLHYASLAQVDAAWARLLYQTDLEVAEHWQEPAWRAAGWSRVVENAQHPDLQRTFPWQGHACRYEFDPDTLARRLQEELSQEGRNEVILYGATGQQLTRSIPDPQTAQRGFSLPTIPSTVNTTLTPLQVTAVLHRFSPFSRVASPWRVGLFLTAVLLFPFVTAWVFARRVTAPLQSLEETSRLLASGDLGARVQLKAGNEIGRLGGTLNWMASQLQEREALLQENNLRLQEINQLKSLFLASVSHELRTPLTAILGQTQMLIDDLRGPLSPEQRDTVEKTQRNAASLLRLIDDLLDLGKIEAGHMNMLDEEFLLEDCAHDALGAVEPQLKAKGLELDFRGCAESWVRGDYARTRQILINLLANAVKFTQEGRVSVTVEPAAAHICDSGPGIPPHLQEAVFDEFRQADSGVSRKYGGSGLGLAIARKLARLQGGSLTLESQVGEGARFTLTLPPAPPAPAAPD